MRSDEELVPVIYPFCIRLWYPSQNVHRQDRVKGAIPRSGPRRTLDPAAFSPAWIPLAKYCSTSSNIHPKRVIKPNLTEEKAWKYSTAALLRKNWVRSCTRGERWAPSTQCLVFRLELADEQSPG